MKKLRFLAFLMLACLAIETRAEAPAKKGKEAKPATKAAVKVPVKKQAAPKERDRDANEIELQTVQDQLDLMKFTNGRLQHLRFYDEGDCVGCFAATAGTGNSSLDKSSDAESCKKTWSNYYSKPVIDISFVYGYEDFYDDSVSADRIRRQAMIRKVTEPCEENNLVRACGFKETDDADIFEKSVTGPDEKTHTVRLKLVASSFSVSDRINRNFVDEQTAASKKAADAFYESYESADTSLYIGHARDSGGPDFSPAILKANGKVDYDYYRKNKPGLAEFDRRILGKKTSPKILGFLACNSERWAASMASRAPKSGLLLSPTDEIPAEVATAQAYAILDSILWQRCSEAFDRAINQIDAYDGKAILPISFRRFFKK